MLREHVLKSGARQVLEVGCGTGNFIGALAALPGVEAFGVDPTPDMLAVARQRGHRVAYSTGSAEHTGQADGAFDFIYSVDVIHFVDDLPAMFREAHRILRPEKVVCTITDSEEIIRRRVPLTTYFPETIAVEAARYPKPDEIHRAMAECGFGWISSHVIEYQEDLTDIGVYRSRAASSLRLISEEAWRRGLSRLEADLERGPIRRVSPYLVIWGVQPAA